MTDDGLLTTVYFLLLFFMSHLIFIASNNAHKHQEMREIFALHGVNDVTWLSPKSLGFDLDPDETADTYVGNALIKARAFVAAVRDLRAAGSTADTAGGTAAGTSPYDLSTLWILADDSGLEVDALNGRPGLLSARYHKAAPNGDGCTALLTEMKDVPGAQRTARFRAIIALAQIEGPEHLFEGVCEGSITREIRGAGGFGFDPVFDVGDGRTMSEIPSTEKSSISHRGLAVKQAIDFLRQHVSEL